MKIEIIEYRRCKAFVETPSYIISGWMLLLAPRAHKKGTDRWDLPGSRFSPGRTKMVGTDISASKQETQSRGTS